MQTAINAVPLVLRSFPSLFEFELVLGEDKHGSNFLAYFTEAKCKGASEAPICEECPKELQTS
jgi:hypothetical protein